MDVRCPVCATPETGRELCEVCGVRLYGDPVLGAATARDLAAAETALGAARHAWDLRAAALVAPGPESDGHRRLTAALGGTPPGDGHVPAGAPREETGDSTRVQALLAGRAQVSFLECAPNGLHLTQVQITRAGIPVPGDTSSTPWRSVVPALDGDPTLRRFQLAGGVGTLPPVDRRAFDEAVRAWLAESLRTAPGATAVLLRSAPGWELLRRAGAVAVQNPAVRLAADGDGGAPEGRPGGAVRVRRLLRTLPLPADHTLLLARVDPHTGAVHPHSRVLFPAGLVLPTDSTPLLPVLAGPPAPGTPALAVRQLKVRALEPERLTFALRGPGEVELVAPAGERTPEEPTADLSRLLAALPRRMVRPPALELLLTVDLGSADRAETEERLTFVREVAALLARKDPAGATVRAGAVGHYDHTDYETAWAKAGLLLRAPVVARPPAELLAALATWSPAPGRQDTVSSLEDALHEAAVLTARRPVGADSDETCRVLLVVGGRPPAPARQHGVVPACPRGTDWRTALGRLRAGGFRLLARTHPATGPPAPDAAARQAGRYAAEAWRALGADGVFRPGADSPQDVVRALDPPWRHEGPACPLAFATPLR
ncbi:hypothetical protein [Streptomyces sp. Vc17.3-30]|uniref:hypothetical protein n=1 Tax=Streptomyces sp. Vc17.3-30 TaxID=2841672 RepID=UPI0020963D0F|nr:hypothetical protein [Streptomyces sp. Vc17.3-30]MCO6698499.1 hypothetical protein [Streptomyces sp. Vc17.3-30]